MAKMIGKTLGYHQRDEDDVLKPKKNMKREEDIFWQKEQLEELKEEEDNG